MLPSWTEDFFYIVILWNCVGQENSGLQTSLEKLAQIVSIQNIEVLLYDQVIIIIMKIKDDFSLLVNMVF